MNLYELIHEFLFDCKVRELSEQTVKNYEKQLRVFFSYFVPLYTIEAVFLPDVVFLSDEFFLSDVAFLSDAGFFSDAAFSFAMIILLNQ